MQQEDCHDDVAMMVLQYLEHHVMMLGVNLREAFNSEIRLKFEFEPSLL